MQLEDGAGQVSHLLPNRRATVVAIFACAALGATVESRAYSEARQDDTAKTLDQVFPQQDGLVSLTEENLDIYHAVASGDLADFACALLIPYKAQCEKAQDAKVADESLHRDVRKDKRAKALLSEWRASLASREFVVVQSKLAPHEDQGGLSYDHGRFTLSVGSIDETGGAADKLQQTVVLGFGSDGVAVGTWSRVKWSRVAGGGAVGTVTLTGMPTALKERIEKDFGESIKPDGGGRVSRRSSDCTAESSAENG